MKQRTFFADVGGRGGTGDVLYLSGFNVERIVISAKKTDAGSAGQLFAENMILKPYNAYITIPHDDVPTSFYPFVFAAANSGANDGGTVAHEFMGGSLMTVTGGNGILGIGPYVTRGGGCAGTIDINSNVNVTNGGLLTLMIAENAAQSWTWEGWIFRNANSNTCIAYRESNAGLTPLDIIVDTSGHLLVQHNGSTFFTSSNAIAGAAWTHCCLSYNSGTGQITPIIGGVSGTATAYTRGSWAGTRVDLNQANGQLFLSHFATYKNVAFTVDDCLRHMHNMTVDLEIGNFVSGTANISNGNGGTVIFSNEQDPGFDATSYTVRMPLTAVNAIQTGGGIFNCQIDTWERETI